MVHQLATCRKQQTAEGMNDKIKGWEILRSSGCKLADVVAAINPVIKEWASYYGQFYKTKLINFIQLINVKLARWARRKYKRLRTSDMKAIRWLHGNYLWDRFLFAYWKIKTHGLIMGAV